MDHDAGTSSMQDRQHTSPTSANSSLQANVKGQGHEFLQQKWVSQGAEERRGLH